MSERPTAALVAQLDLIEWCKTAVAAEWGGWFINHTVGADKLQLEQGWLNYALADKLNRSETVFVSRDMCDVIEHAAHTMPDIPLQEEQMFWKNAFIFFERPIENEFPLGTNDDEILATKAIWTGVEQGQIVDSDLAVAFAEQAGVADWRDLPEEVRLEIQDDFKKPGMSHVTFVDIEGDDRWSTKELGTTIFPFDMSGWVFGKRWTTVSQKLEKGGSTVDQSLSQQRKLVLATLLISQQYVSVLSSHKGVRQQRRRAERLGMTSPNYGDITYITLRRPSNRNEDRRAAEGFEYSYRFGVRGHWKNQWYPSKGEHHLIWIDPYIKGPENKPLIIKDRVFKVVR